MPKTKLKPRADGRYQKAITDSRTGKRVFFYGFSEREINQKILEYTKKAEKGRTQARAGEAARACRGGSGKKEAEEEKIRPSACPAPEREGRGSQARPRQAGKSQAARARAGRTQEKEKTKQKGAHPQS